MIDRQTVGGTLLARQTNASPRLVEINSRVVPFLGILIDWHATNIEIKIISPNLWLGWDGEGGCQLEPIRAMRRCQHLIGTTMLGS